VLRKRSLRANLVPAQVGAGSQMLLRASNLQTNIPWKPTRVGVRADDIGAKRLEEACIPRDGGFEAEFCTTQRKKKRPEGRF
jgi:hypothetical protein